jgi:hypothetical protein
MAERDEIASAVAIAISASAFQNLALIGALAERKKVDPAKVAAWADFFAKGLEASAEMPGPANPAHLRQVAPCLRDYAGQIVNMVTAPAAAGHG